ncbi:MAG: GerMN domain-containing protein [Patescibacteria group bacterium]
MTKKRLLIIFGFFALFAFGILTLRILSGEDDWICVKGEWVKHGNPSAAMPTQGCGEPVEEMTVKVFFNNSVMDPENSCDKVFSAERKVKKTPAVARAALDELLKGPTEEEKTKGFFTSINDEVKINFINIDSDGNINVDFDEQLENSVGGSCRVSAIRSQITETLKQFSTVKNVIISINNRTEDILQP